MSQQPSDPISPQILQEATLEVRLQGAQEALKRTRLAFSASTIATLAIIIAVWNATISWNRRFAVVTDLPNSALVEKETLVQLVKQYVDNTTIAISPLGIRIGVSDLAVVGSLGLLVLSIWLYFCIRRQNHTVGFLLQSTKDARLEILQRVYWGISSFLVFTTVSFSDSPISTLEGTEVEKPYRPARWAVTFLYYLPALVVPFIMGTDFYSIYWQKHLLTVPIESASEVKAWVMEIFALALGLAIAILCYKIDQFERATTSVLRKYREQMQIMNRATKAAASGL